MPECTLIRHHISMSLQAGSRNCPGVTGGRYRSVPASYNPISGESTISLVVSCVLGAKRRVGGAGVPFWGEAFDS